MAVFPAGSPSGELAGDLGDVLALGPCDGQLVSAKRLRELERSGLVARAIFAEVPPRVEYRLTDLGATLIPALAGLHQWAERYAPAVDENRRRADQARAEADGVETAG